MADLKDKIFVLAQQVAGDLGLRVFDVELLGKGKFLLRVTIDKDGTVTIDDCEQFSRSLGAFLDVEDLLQRSYTLEVSSPGLDRPLRGIEDFQKYEGKLARIITSEKIDNQNFFIGRILRSSDHAVTLQIKDCEIEIPINVISKARLEIELKCPKNSVSY